MQNNYKVINPGGYVGQSTSREIGYARSHGKTVHSLSPLDSPSESRAVRITPPYITELKEGEIFVFGSNKEGLHGGGAARIAYEEFGAKWGEGVGMTGRCYAIPTMDGSLDLIRKHVDDFTAYAAAHPELTFLVTRIGCGIAGWKDSEIAPLFKIASRLSNVSLPEEFWSVLKI